MLERQAAEPAAALERQAAQAVCRDQTSHGSTDQRTDPALSERMRPFTQGAQSTLRLRLRRLGSLQAAKAKPKHSLGSGGRLRERRNPVSGSALYGGSACLPSVTLTCPQLNNERVPGSPRGRRARPLPPRSAPNRGARPVSSLQVRRHDVESACTGRWRFALPIPAGYRCAIDVHTAPNNGPTFRSKVRGFERGRTRHHGARVGSRIRRRRRSRPSAGGARSGRWAFAVSVQTGRSCHLPR